MDSFWEILSNNPLALLVSGILGYWVKASIENRHAKELKSVQSVYDKDLQHKQNQNDTNLRKIIDQQTKQSESLKAVLLNYSNNQESLQKKRIDACCDLWNTYIILMEKYSKLILLYSILKPEEYKQKIPEEIDSINEADFYESYKRLLSKKPFIPDALWTVFIGKKNFLSRLKFKSSSFAENSQSWCDDDQLYNLSELILEMQNSDYTIEEGSDIGILDKVISEWERLILEEVKNIIKGDDPLKNIAELDNLLVSQSKNYDFLSYGY